jgi:hypothetical protein
MVELAQIGYRFAGPSRFFEGPGALRPSARFARAIFGAPPEIGSSISRWCGSRFANFLILVMGAEFSGDTRCGAVSASVCSVLASRRIVSLKLSLLRRACFSTARV